MSKLIIVLLLLPFLGAAQGDTQTIGSPDTLSISGGSTIPLPSGSDTTGVTNAQLTRYEFQKVKQLTDIVKQANDAIDKANAELSHIVGTLAETSKVEYKFKPRLYGNQVYFFKE